MFQKVQTTISNDQTTTVWPRSGRKMANFVGFSIFEATKFQFSRFLAQMENEKLALAIFSRKPG